MAEQPSPWQRLLVGYNRKPTLPFIIGALREHVDSFDRNGDSFQQVFELLQDMAGTPIPGKPGARIFVQRCAQLNAPVFSIVNGPYELDCAAQFGLGPDEPNRLCFSREIEQSAGVELEEVADRLFHGYGHPEALQLHRYSRDPDSATWRAFDKTDHRKIIAALQSDAERGEA